MDNQLSLSIQRAIRQYKPIKTGALTLYPVLVRDIDLFQLARQSLDVLQQSLPVALMSKPLLQALYQLDYEAAVKGEPITGLFSDALLLLSLSLRIGWGSAEDILKSWQIKVDPNDQSRLKNVSTVLNGEELIEITPVQFQKLRPIIAAQNGVKLESDDANPDLVKAERDLAELNAPKLDVSVDQMIASVCTLTGADEEEVENWAILKLQKRAESLQRAMDYIVCGIGGAFGGFGKGGNPVPHPFYERTEKYTGNLVAAEGFMGGAAENAIQNQGTQTTL